MQSLVPPPVYDPLTHERRRPWQTRGPRMVATANLPSDLPVISTLAPRRDPAPTRWSYRMQRLWLTPAFRLFMRLGLPLLLCAGLAGVWLSDTTRRGQLIGWATDLRDKFEHRPEFMVNLMAIEGAAPDLADAIRAKLALPLPLSSFDMDLPAMRSTVEAFDAVAHADLRIRSGGILAVVVTERVPVMLWRASTDRLEMLDTGGHRVASLTARQDRADLPLIAGDGADLAAPEALELVAAAAPFGHRLRGLVRMGGRRWDIVLDRDQRILLPATGAVSALERLIADDRADDLLARDVTTFDLRNPLRPTVRLSQAALVARRDAAGAAVSKPKAILQ